MAESHRLRLPSSFRNGHLHLALLLALAAASLIAIAVPITRGEGGGPPPRPAAVVAGDGLLATFSAHAEAVASTVTAAAFAPDGERALYATALDSVPGARLVPPSLLTAVARVATSAALVSPYTRSSLIIQRQEAVPFTIHDHGFVSNQLSTGLTVGQALADLGVKLRASDLVLPSRDTPLSPGLHVYVRYATPVELSFAGERFAITTHSDTVGDLLAEAGIRLAATDRIFPALTEPVHAGMTVQVTTVREEIEQIADPVPYVTIYWDDPDLLEGNEQLVQAGSPGYVRGEYRVLYVNGQEVKRERLAESVVAPTDEIVSQGSFAPAVAPPVVAAAPAAATTATTSSGDCVRTLKVYATWYTAASAGGSGITATGTGVYRGIIAVDPSVIPLGTELYVPGYGYGVAADTGGAIVGNWIDLGYGPGDVYDWSTRWVDICILG